MGALYPIAIRRYLVRCVRRDEFKGENMRSNSCLFGCARFLLFCLCLLALGIPSFGQAKKEYTFKNGKLVGVSESCTLFLSSNSADAPLEGSSGSISVTGSSLCSWNAESNVSWIHTVSSGTGNGTVNYSVDANPGDSRSGTITIGDHDQLL
jgi:hypothetical protein